MFSFWMYQGQIQGQMSNKVAEQPSTVAKQFWKNKLDTTTKSRPSRGFLFKKVTTPSNSPQRKLHFPEIPCVLPHDCHSLPSRPISRYPHRISHHTPCNSFPAKEWKQASPPQESHKSTTSLLMVHDLWGSSRWLFLVLSYSQGNKNPPFYSVYATSMTWKICINNQFLLLSVEWYGTHHL